MAQVAFGLFDWIDRGNVSLHQLYQERWLCCMNNHRVLITTITSN
jgi:hypothetical protein